MFRVGVLSVLLAILAPPAFGSSDLTPAIYDPHFETDASVDPGDVSEGCAGAATGRTLLRFGTRVTNLGPDDLVIGNPGCPDCQTNPGVSCQDPRFVCSASNYRVHFRSAAEFELLDPAGADVVVGSKRGYCFNDDACASGKSPQFTSCDGVQGLSVGCVDDYEPFLDCQYLDVTDVPNVTTRAFRLRVTIDTADLLPDPDRANNVVEIAIPGCGDGIVQEGEECDPGPGRDAACCDATCHLVPAGTTCRPTTGPCDAAEVCDGMSPDCPADVAMPDGTTCGAGTPPCLAKQCRAGRCESSLAAGACLVESRCATAGAADPADGCAECDPVRATEAWSPDVAADERGVRCQLNRVTAAVQRAACRPRVFRSIRTPLRQVRRAIDHEFRATSNLGRGFAASLRLARRLSRALDRAGTRDACNVEDATAQVDVLVAQLSAMAGR